MKYIVLLAAAVLCTAAGSQAQSKTGAEKRASQPGTTLSPSPGKAGTETVNRPTNVSQTRDYELDKQNGYYQMPGEQNWGTNAHLNGFPYPVVKPSIHPDTYIDTRGEQIQSGLYDNGRNASGEGAPVRSKIDQRKRADLP